MKSKKRPLAWHLDRALEHMTVIHRHMSRGLDLDDPLLRDAVSMQLAATIDALKAANTVSEDAVAGSFGDAWTKIQGMRNALVHEYFEVNVEVLKSTIENDLPETRRIVEQLREALGEGSANG